MHPEREWVIGLSIATLFFIATASLGAYTYFKNQSFDAQATAADSEEVVYRESLVQQVLQQIQQRAQTVAELNKGIRADETVVQPEIATSSLEVSGVDPSEPAAVISIE